MVNVTLEEFLTELEKLVNIDSFSRYPEGTAKVAAYLQEKYQALGWHVEKRDVGTEVGPVLVITNKPDATEYDVMLSGHMDTVFPPGTVAERPFTKDDTQAYGPGVSDMKNGLLAGYYALKTLQENGELDNISVAIVHNPDEEISSRYSRPVIEEVAKKSRHAVIMESARINGNLVNERKGVGKFVVEFHGKSAHAATNPQDGANALQEFILTAPEIMTWGNPDKGTTVNIGIISGGTTANSIPDYTRIEVDVRITDMAEGQRVTDLFTDLPNHMHIAGVTATVTGAIYRPPMPFTEKTAEFCKAVDEIIARLGIKAGWEASAGGSDGNFSAALGVPTIDGLGPQGGHFHSVDENLITTTILERIDLLCEVIKYCGKK